MRQRADAVVDGLAPGSFSVVMACGIVADGLQLTDHAALSVVPAAVCVLGYLALVLLTGWRVVAHRSAMVRDLRDPARAFGFFTFVAGSNVVGILAYARGWVAVTAVLLLVAGTAWLVLGYLVPGLVFLGRPHDGVIAAANGTWFVWVVSSQSVAVAAASLEVAYTGARQFLAVLAVLAWSAGMFQYAVVGGLVLIRLVRYPLRPTEIDPPYWVSMGALSITVVAGSRIVEMASAPMVDAVRELVAGTSVVVWCVATWLLPVLLAVGWWRHVRHRVPLRFEAGQWSMIFPMGMYAVAGIDLGRVDHLPLVEWIGSTWLWVAVGAWAAVLVAMLAHAGHRVIEPARRA